MTTKEEMLERYRDDSKFPNINEVVFSKSDVLEAMSEYARARSIEFAVFINDKQLYKIDDLWYKSEDSSFVPIFDDDLYTIFDEDSKTK